MMKCPYRKVIVHQPEIKDGERIRYKRTSEEFADCYGEACPLYCEYVTATEEVYEMCSRAGNEVNIDAE